MVSLAQSVVPVVPEVLAVVIRQYYADPSPLVLAAVIRVLLADLEETVVCCEEENPEECLEETDYSSCQHHQHPYVPADAAVPAEE